MFACGIGELRELGVNWNLGETVFWDFIKVVEFDCRPVVVFTIFTFAELIWLVELDWYIGGGRLRWVEWSSLQFDDGVLKLFWKLDETLFLLEYGEFAATFGRKLERTGGW